MATTPPEAAIDVQFPPATFTMSPGQFVFSDFRGCSTYIQQVGKLLTRTRTSKQEKTSRLSTEPEYIATRSVLLGEVEQAEPLGDVVAVKVVAEVGKSDRILKTSWFSYWSAMNLHIK